jgi:secreted trypsin-like serine protease
MKRIVVFFFLSFMTSLSFAQKAEIKILRTKDASVSDWQILDEKYLSVLSGEEYQPEDSVIFSLEGNRRYFLNISVSEINMPDTCLYTLFLNGEAIIRVNSGIGYGDWSFPFFTGVKTDETAKITGGTDADISQFPWQVYFEADDYVCGGAIIDENWIVTAAHCTKGEYNESIPASKMDIIVGANNPRNPSQGKKYLVSQVITHENYDLQTYNYDIALLKLEEPVNYTNAQPVKIVSEKDVQSGATDPGVMSWVTGYGAIRVNPEVFPSVLQKVTLPIVSNEQASVVWKNIPETNVMAGYLNGNKDACIGDSGGPLVVPADGGYKLAGLVSWGSSSCNTYGAYTRLSLFESWITEKTGIEITFRAPVPIGDSIICPGTSSSNYNVGAVKGATAYTWLLAPDDAGSIEGTNENATVTWNPLFKGSASVSLQVSRADELSVASYLIINSVNQTAIKTEPEDKVICAEQYLSLKVVAEGYNLLYKWYKNDTLYSTGPSGDVINSNAVVDDSGNYFCMIEGSCGNAVSRTANLTVLPVTRIKSISQDQDVVFGQDLALEINSEGHDLTYQWYKDDNRLNHGIEKEYDIQNADAGDIGLYKATVTGSCGTETSNNIYVYVRNNDSPDENDLIVWPTVVINDFSIATDNEKKYSFVILDNTGRIIRHSTDCQYQTNVNIADLPSGLYFVTVYNNSLRKSVKILKK